MSVIHVSSKTMIESNSSDKVELTYNIGPSYERVLTMKPAAGGRLSNVGMNECDKTKRIENKCQRGEAR